ncbi:MAG: hypothetical protein M3150_03700, partial [Pseudomonadota bacterium]|nr:hypothetical protein [Pseudomonadota bacterium]
SFFLRANLIGAALSVGLALVVMLLGQRRIRDGIAFVAGGLGAAALVSLAIVAWLASAGALEAFWDQAFHYNFLYAASGLRSKVGALHFGASTVTKYAAAPIALAGWVLCLRRVWAGRRDMQFPAVYLLALLWLPIELVLGATSGRQYSHYFATGFAPVALLAAGFVAEVELFAPAGLAQGKGLLVFRALALGTALWAMAGAGMTLFQDRERDRREQVAATAAYVRASTPSGARVLVWGHSAEVHFFSDRLPASRFVYPLALLTPRYADAALVDKFIDELRASAPALIVDATPNAAEGEDLVPTLASWNPDWRYPKDAPPGREWWAMTPQLRTFYDYVHANYVPVQTVGPRHWVMYRRVVPDASHSGGR